MMDAGNIEGALESLGVSVHSSQGIVKAVTEEREKELRRLEKTLEFKQQMDYNTPQAKENALAMLQTKIQSVKEQLKTIGVRLDQCNITEECPICYENSKENNCTLTPCCNHMFCGKCILQSLARQPTCPMCRANVIATQLIHIVKTTENKKHKKKEVSKLLSKSNQLLEFLKSNPTAQVLIFSRYENPFTSLGNKFTEEGISHHILSGNKDVVASTIRAFETGEKRVLFLPTQSAGAGINLVTATHVVLLHAMTPDEEKQVIGRAYRLGRKDPLHVIHLLHEAEQPL
jgi:SNF2 family DNA or RNA helicase